MADQLELIEMPAQEWGLDEATRDAGRQGIAAARRALARAHAQALADARGARPAAA